MLPDHFHGQYGPMTALAAAAAVTTGFSIDIIAKLIPGAAIPLEDAHMAWEVAITDHAIDFLRCTNGNNGAIRTERDRIS